jgi:hypothetical protein
MSRPGRWPAARPVELALKVCFSGLLLGLVLFVAVMAALAPLAAILAQRLPGYEFLVVLATGTAAIATVLLDFYVLLPAFSDDGVPATRADHEETAAEPVQFERQQADHGDVPLDRTLRVR